MDHFGSKSHEQSSGSPHISISAFERVSLPESEGNGSYCSNNVKDDFSAQLPPLVNDLRLESPSCCPCPAVGKKVLYLGNLCCLHEAFVSCTVAKNVVMIGERGGCENKDNEGLVKEVQELIPGWCSSIGLPDVNLSVGLGSARALKEAGIKAGSVDIIIGCNVFCWRSEDEALEILANAFEALVTGGEFNCTEVISDRRLPSYSRVHPYLVSSGLSTAMYIGDFKRLAQAAGFLEPRLLNLVQNTPDEPEAQVALGSAKIYQATIRMFKLPQLEQSCEDYGQVAVYKGTIPQCEAKYQLDIHHVFIKNQPKLICGNTAAILGEGGLSWLHPHFHVQGDRSVGSLNHL